MSDSEMLNRQLTAMENGASPEISQDQLPAGERELRPLLDLATQIRSLDHPELNPEIASAQKAQLIETSGSLAQPQRKTEIPLGRRSWRGPARVAAIGLVLLVVLFAVTLIVAGMWPDEQQLFHQVTVEGATGIAEVSGDGEWKPVKSGDRLTAGKRIRTGSDSSLTLAFFEGTRTTLGPDTDVTLTTVDGTAGTLRILLSQHAGKTSHIVVPLQGEDGFFVVDTPTGRASVQGTVFDVMVGSGGQAFFNVDEGRVKVTGTGQDVLLQAGQSITASAGEEPELLDSGDCTYGKGFWKNHLDDWPIATLTLGGVSYDQAGLLAILGTPPRGDATYILASQLIAAKLNVSAGATSSAIDATITAADAWLVINPIGSGPAEPFRQDGIDLAEMLDAYNSGVIGPGSCDDEDPVSTQAITPTVTLTPTATITSTITATTVTTDCTGADPHPHATTLAAQYIVPYDEIMGWKCSGFGFGEIEHAYNLSEETGIPVADIFALRLTGLGWGQLRKQLLDDVTGEDGRPGGNPNKNSGDNPHGKKDKGNKNKDDGDTAGIDIDNNGNNTNSSNGQGNNGQGNNGQGNNGHGNNGQGNNGHGNNGNSNNGNGNNGQGTGD